MALSKLLNLGVKPSSKNTDVKITITNTVTLLTCGLTLFYALYFFVFLEQIDATLINLVFVGSYGFTFYFSSKSFYRLAKLWFFSVFVFHIFILTTQVFSSAIGFHFYLLILPSGVFLLFNEEEKLEKMIVFLVGMITFFVCHNYENANPLVTLPSEIEQAIFTFSIVIVMLENFFVMSVFSLAISRHEAVLKEMATKDVLTGINNRRTFMLIGEELVAHAKRYKKPLTLLLFDIDFFKRVNDSYGHLVGDQALKIVARVLQDNLRASDCLARYGGEEFVVVLPETDAHAAKDLAESLRKAVAGLEIPLSDSKQRDFINCTISVGISENINVDMSLTDLVQQADTALYQAKGAGRNCVVAFIADTSSADAPSLDDTLELI